MTSPDPSPEAPEPVEPRFAGPVFAGAKAGWPVPSPPPATHPPVVPVDGSAVPLDPSVPSVPSVPPDPFDPDQPAPLGWATGPIVSYDSEPAPERLERKEFAPLWVASSLAIVGGVLVGVASFLTWVTLRIEALNSAAASVNDGTPTVAYGGLSLLEGRAMLLLAAVAIVLSILRLLRRVPPAGAAMGVAGIGAMGVAVMALTAIDRPSSLATLFRSYETVDSIRVHFPNGPGIWLALGGSVLILLGGLVGMARRAPAGP